MYILMCLKTLSSRLFQKVIFSKINAQKHADQI